MFLPTTRDEMNKRGWDECDVIIVTPDAYVDHPSFAMAILGRFLEKNGYRVGILSQPHWKDPQSFLELGIPKIAFAISGGQMDSMVLNYTATKIPRKEDLFCEDKNPFFSIKGEKKYRIRPDRCVSVYCSQIKSVCKDKPIIIGGIEASLRRIVHYDFWSDKIKKSILVDSKANILIYGMGEYPLLNVIRALEAGVSLNEAAIENTVVLKKEADVLDLIGINNRENNSKTNTKDSAPKKNSEQAVVLPSYDEIIADTTAKNKKESNFGRAFAKAQVLFEENSDSKILLQKQDTRYLVQYPRKRLTQEELDNIYSLHYERRIHPRYKNVPAFEMIKTSVTSHRGCFGGCSFCAISMHQGREVVSRSEESVISEIKEIASQRGFSGTITDIGGPSANMYGCECAVAAGSNMAGRTGGCLKHDCLKDGFGCKNLISGNEKYLKLLNSAADIWGVKNIQVNSGVRFDPCILSDKFLRAILLHHISGQMKVAPESASDFVLGCMSKPKSAVFESFLDRFERIKKEERLKKYVIPYIIAGHPGESEKEAKETENLLAKHRLTGRQFQIFTPTPMTRSTAMYFLGYDPFTNRRLYVEKDTSVLMKRKDKFAY